MTGRLTPQLKLINAKSAANEFVFVTNSADATPRLSDRRPKKLSIAITMTTAPTSQIMLFTISLPKICC